MKDMWVCRVFKWSLSGLADGLFWDPAGDPVMLAVSTWVESELGMNAG